MLYINPAIVLAATAGELDTPVFLWDNLVTLTGITADEEDASYPATNLANPQTSSVWKGETTGDQNIVFDVNPSSPINAMGLARHNFGSTAAGLQIYGITADIGAVFELLAELSPGDDSPILAIFEAGYYVQIKLAIAPGPSVPQLAVAYVGSLLTMPRSTPAGFVLPKDGLEREKLDGLAENGDFLGDVITSEVLRTSIDFKLIEGAWYRESMRAFVQSPEPFFFSRAPAQLPDEGGYAKIAGSVPKGQVNQFTGEMDVSIPITALAL